MMYFMQEIGAVKIKDAIFNKPEESDIIWGDVNDFYYKYIIFMKWWRDNDKARFNTIIELD